MRNPILVLHICGGIVGLLSGAVAMSFRKGSSQHRLAGKVFVVSMLVMGVCATYLAVRKHQTDNFFGGLITIYMVSTSWRAGRPRQTGPGPLDYGALALALGIGVSMMTLAIRVATGLSQAQAGVPLGMYFFLPSIALLAAAGDVRMMARGSLSSAQRVPRHLWRMCFGWFIASGSFFLGKQQHFPVWLQGSSFLVFLAVLPLLLLIFWLIRVRFAPWQQPKKLTTVPA